MVRAIAKQAEAERERRAKVIHAEGEFQAADKLTQAADIISRNPQALQLRFLGMLTEISAERTPRSSSPCHSSCSKRLRTIRPRRRNKR